MASSGLHPESRPAISHVDARTAAVHGVTASLSGRRWVWRAAEDRLGLAIAQRLDVPEIVGRLLAARGVDADAAADFLDPTLRALLPDPHVLADMPAAAERLARAVAAGETVGVFGDYDVDGACSTALVVSVLRQLGCTVLPHIPDRTTEGYGPNAPALQHLLLRGATLVVCVDCGTAAEAALACLHGRADAIVLDHHKSEGPPPPVVATVNPNRLDCGSGLGHLCATAVAFLAAVALVRVLRRAGWFAARPEPDLMHLLDIVALATVCDVMPLVGVNRALVVQGLRMVARGGRPGLAALLQVADVRGVPDAMTLGYGLGPRINAGGRIGEADLGLRLLLARDPTEAASLASMLNAVNRQRQQVEGGIVGAAIEIADAQLQAGHSVVLACGVQWHPGVVGIIAGRLRERFNRPACVAGLADAMAKGSGRSMVGLDLGAAVIAARQTGILETGGGHALAAGFTCREERLGELHAWLDDRLAGAAAHPSAADLLVEGSVAVAGASVELAGQIARLSPFGNGNEEPVLAIPRARVVRADRVGREGATIRAFLSGEEAGPRLKAVMFRAGEGEVAAALLGRADAPLHLAGHLRADEWQGERRPSFVVLDAAPA